MIVVGYIFIKKEQNEMIKATYPLKYMEEIEKYSQEFGVNKYLLLSFIKTESGFDEKAKSSAGAIGLTQITEETFSWIKLKLCPGEDVVFEDLYLPDTAIRFGAYYISRCLERYEYSVDTAAAAYHSGWGTVDKLLEEQQSDVLVDFPYSQMKHYVYKINKAYNQYQELYEKKDEV
ncbi:MAG: lytic transglycosylase domain-containing protein [Oscillospiraceae bacterium]